MNLNMNLHDLALWEQERLKAFAIPHKDADNIIIGQTVGIKEPFKKLTITEPFEKDGKTQDKKVCVGVKYRADGKITWVGNALSQYDEASKWSPAFLLPDFAIRRHAVIYSVDDEKPIRSITEEELRLMCLDYGSQNDPQLLLDEYLPIKNFELLYHWWKEHYKATLKNTDSPLAILLCVQPA